MVNLSDLSDLSCILKPPHLTKGPDQSNDWRMGASAHPSFPASITAGGYHPVHHNRSILSSPSHLPPSSPPIPPPVVHTHTTPFPSIPLLGASLNIRSLFAILPRSVLGYTAVPSESGPLPRPAPHFRHHRRANDGNYG
ncbi:hypothetical protein BO70DRAFT_119078 [Aspergillus heteromorphus CBS 117.55]|uniref:Uncharacterized protein n=1 Tax=Aspergillus heteromorphus CBS 117.55 TaxID=1448321 RepID=A0A317VDU5_9EURO|nr:uncharacterized protein BO70DRAFT_119078 [Aspergillus heteromorphus CBS 117.55]PWY71609.1 hypothetical protein BO70DRAFT_119078 [Aspergillus heteromorphus CBS 117.55]